jgi:hypothetical protein
MIDARFGKVEVTPARRVMLAGFGSRREPHESVTAPLELNAALLRQDDRALLIVSGDFLYFSAALLDRLVERFGQALGLTASSILLAASHTHFAPNLDPSKPLLGAVDPDYVRFLEGRLEALVDGLTKTPVVRVTVRHARVMSNHNTNRRVLDLDDEGHPVVDYHRSDPGGACDPWLDVLRFDDEANRLRCVAVRYACHPISSTRLNSVNPDFPGVIRGTLRERSQAAELPVLFLQGFAGQLRPEANASRAGGGSAAPEIALEPVPRSVFTEGRWTHWAKSLAENACMALETAATAPRSMATLSSDERAIPLGELIHGLPAGHEAERLRIQAVTLTPSIVLVAFSCEPTSGWADIVRDLLPGKAVLPVGYVNQVFGYLPTAREAIQGGYEVDGFKHFFSLEGPFAPDFAERVRRELADLVAPLAAETDAAAYSDHISQLRKTIDELLSERDHMRARMLRDRTASKAATSLAEARLAGIEARSEQLGAAAAEMRQRLRAALGEAAHEDGTQTRTK